MLRGTVVVRHRPKSPCSILGKRIGLVDPVKSLAIADVFTSLVALVNQIDF